MAWGFSFLNTSSHSRKPGKVFDSWIHNSVVTIDKVIISSIWSTFNPLSILYFLIKEVVGECLAFLRGLFLTWFLHFTIILPPSSATLFHSTNISLSFLSALFCLHFVLYQSFKQAIILFVSVHTSSPSLQPSLYCSPLFSIFQGAATESSREGATGVGYNGAIQTGGISKRDRTPWSSICSNSVIWGRQGWVTASVTMGPLGRVLPMSGTQQQSYASLLFVSMHICLWVCVCVMYDDSFAIAAILQSKDPANSKKAVWQKRQPLAVKGPCNALKMRCQFG